MTTIGGVTSRTTHLLSSDRLLSALRRTSLALNQAQEQISTGKSVSRPSDAPAKLAAILMLQRQIQARTQYERNLQHSASVLNAADQALADASDIMREAKGIALSQIGIGSDAGTRRAEAAVVESQLAAMIQIANRQVAGVGVFTGAGHGNGNGEAFVPFMGGVRYVGSTRDLNTLIGNNSQQAVNYNGVDAFNLASGMVVGQVDLNPQATADTRLDDVDGALNQGVRRGSVVISVDGLSAVVDLADARTLGDVATRINAAIAAVDPAAGELSLAGGGFQLTATPGHSIQINESGQGKTAADLGIKLSVDSAVAVGADLNPALTESTTLASLGISIDLSSGLKITQGGVTRMADFSAATTIRDLINAVDQLDMGLKLQVNEDGSGLNMVNMVSGVSLSVGENGGTTAGDLGLRTFGLETRLSDLNSGRGVNHVRGENDFEIRLHDGRSFQVNIDGVTTVGELITAIEDAATAAGVAPSDFTVGLTVDGNGLRLEDFTAGGGEFRVVNLGESLAAVDLGIMQSAGDGQALNGTDVSSRRVASLFTDLINLRDALLADDSRGITFALEGMETGIDRLSQARAEVGLRAQRAEQEQERSAQMGITERSLLSDLEDADLTQVISRFTQLQMQLEASLAVGAQKLQMSLLDFLR